MRFFRFAQAISWRYAFGEVCLIVIGITIALGVNSWNTERGRRADEIRILEYLQDSLVEDRVAIEGVISELQAIAVSLKSLRQSLVDQAPYRDNLDREFGSLTYFATSDLNTSVYEALKSRGFDLISNDELRIKIIFVFENPGERLRRSNALFVDSVMGSLRGPPLIGRFEIGFDNQGPFARPFHYEGLVSDLEFSSFLSQRITQIDGYMLGNYRSMVNEVDALNDAIDHQLDRLR